MESTLRTRLKLRHEELIKNIVKADELKSKIEDGKITLSELTEIKVKLSSALKNFEKEFLRVSEFFKDGEDNESLMRDEMRAEELLSDLDILEILNKSNSTGPESTNQATTKLPKLEMCKFDGDILKWPEFWAKFDSCVNSQNLSENDKLSYLFSALTGKALEALRGINITNENYSIALETLKRRFGNKEQVIDAHYDALSKLERGTESTLRCTLDTIQKHIRILETLGENLGGNFLRNLVCSKFPESTLYELNLLTSQDRTLETTLNTLDRIVGAKERSKDNSTVRMTSSATTEALQINTIRKAEKRKLDSTAKNQDKKKRKRHCIFCEGSHYDDQCREYNTFPLRRKRLSAKRLCFKCFKTGHMARVCETKYICCYCKGNHNRALCKQRSHSMKRNKEASTQNKISTGNKINEMNIIEENVDNCTVLTNMSSYLQTGTAMFRHKSHEVPARLLLDSGSQRSYITEKLAKKLEIIPDRFDQLLIYTFGSNIPQERTSPSAEVTIITKRKIEKQLRVNIVPQITDKVKITSLDINKEIDIPADDNSLGEGIDVLIGNDYYFSFIKNKSLRLEENLHLIDTDLGWIVSGKHEDNQNESLELSVITYCQCHGSDCPYFVEPDLPLRNIDMRFLWSLESIGIVDSPKATREEDAVTFFNETVTFNNNRYEVKWPWIEYPPSLPTNFGLAFGRLRSLLKRADEKTLQDYQETLNEQLLAGVIEEVKQQTIPIYQVNPPIHYLPHHMVQQEGKRGRVVYDASAKVKNERSLNECMYRGPSMLEDLTALLLQFRVNKIGIIADIEKAFLQVGLQESERDVTRFLWVKNTEEELSEDNLLHYRFCRVPFGVISSPFLLNATIRYHLSKSNEDLLTKIANKCYVDNLISGAQSQKDALHLYIETKRVFEEISMNLRDWISNDKDFLKTIPKKYRAKECDKMKVLGLVWNLDDDTLKLKSMNKDETNKRATKKDILRTLARVYDPCGFVSPWILPAKLLFQQTCTNKLKWDAILPDSLQKSWSEIIIHMQEINEIHVPRYIGCKEGIHASYDLHCFTDASKNAYAAVVYIVSNDGVNKNARLLMSKSRITPAEDKTDLKIPRLELLGYLIGSRLLKYVSDNLGLDINNKYLWTDSLIVLAWMKTSKLLPPFVLRRVNEIKLQKDIQLRYVNTKLNPADIATRPEAIKQKMNFWFSGPDFLIKPETEWPNQNKDDGDRILVSVGKDLDIVDSPEMSVKGYEDIEEIMRQVQEPDKNELSQLQTSDEEETGFKCEDDKIREIQRNFFPDEVNGKVTALTRNLGLFLDENKILRCKGRMCNTTWTYNMKYPILLPKHCEYTNKIITETHERNYHVGVAHTLSIIRQKFWIPQGRAQVQRILRKCPRCERQGGGPYKLPPTPALPPERVNLNTPFSCTGVDYFGPLFVRSEKGKEKRWICLYTCLAIRAIHMEMVQDLTAQECLLALRRFVAIRGLPGIIVSDNGLQFKLTSELLSEPYCKDNKIQWKFIPQLAPWHGGFYERLIGIVKNCLKRTLHKHLLTESQLITVIKEVEAVVNTRPLTYVGSDLDTILKPSDFLTLGNCLDLETSSQGIDPQNVTSTKQSLIEGWKRGHIILTEFKDMFVNQYLSNLRERYKHHPKQPRVTSHKQPRIGDVVQIKDDSKNRINWKVGKISALIQGQDGECRVARVKVGKHEFTRSIGHLYPLEADCEGQLNNEEEYVRNSDTTSQGNNPELIELPVPYPDCRDMEMESDIPDHEARAGRISTASEKSHGSDIANSPTAREMQPEGIVSEVPEETEELEPLKSGDEDEVRNTSIKRQAAIQAREKIAEWTKHLLSIL